MPFDDQPLEAVFEFIGMQQQLSEFQNFAEQMEYRPCGYEGRVAVENSSKIIDGEPKNRQKRPFFAIFGFFYDFRGNIGQNESGDKQETGHRAPPDAAACNRTFRGVGVIPTAL